MKIIINADDFGLTKGVNKAIIKSYQEGILTSATFMLKQKGSQDALNYIANKSIQDVGLHLNLTLGQPVLSPKKIPDLVQENGNFLSKRELEEKLNINKEMIYQELKAQVNLAKDLFYKVKSEITHLDGHHFAIIFPHIKDTFIKLANEVSIPTRRIDLFQVSQDNLKVKTPCSFDYSFYDKGVSIKNFKNIILNFKKENPEGILEIMTHPAYNNKELEEISNYTWQREKELEILLLSSLKEWIEKEQIKRVSFKYLH